jgi:hypothetical protein
MMHVQFSSQNQLTCSIINFNLIGKILNGSTSILTNELLKFSYRHCGADGPTCVLLILNGCLTVPEPRMPFKYPCTVHASSPNACLITARVSVALFPRFVQNLMHTHCSFVGFITNSHQARYTILNKRTSKSAHPPSCMKFCTLTQDMLVPIIYGYIALQLLY